MALTCALSSANAVNKSSSSFSNNLCSKKCATPSGTVTYHFLEHKLFENEEEDLFTAFAEDNAQVNAFTSFDRTSYLFSATDNVDRNIKRLLTMVELHHSQ